MGISHRKVTQAKTPDFPTSWKVTNFSQYTSAAHSHRLQSHRNSYIGLPHHWQWPKHRVFFKPLVPDKAGGVGDPGKLWLSLLTHSAARRATQTCRPSFKTLSILQTFKMPSIPHMSSCTRHHELQLFNRHPPTPNTTKEEKCLSN